MESQNGSGRMSRGYSRRTVVRAGGLAGVGLAAAALVGCGSKKESEPKAGGTPAIQGSTPVAAGTQIKRGGTYKWVDTGDPPTFDPNANTSYSTKTFAAAVYSRLFRIDSAPGINPFERGVVGDLAESAETPDGLNWTIKLKKGVKFHNKAPLSGRELTSEDVLASWRLVTAKTSVSASLVSDIVKVEAIDNYTIKMTTKAPSPTFLETLADANIFYVLPKEAEAGKLDLKTTWVGTGPWMVDSWESSVRMKFSRNPDYYVKDVPYMDGMERVVIPEYANSKAQFEAGNIHAAGIQATDVLDLRGRQPDVQWQGPTYSILNWINFSGEDQDPKAPWRDVRFRQAVSMGIDRDAMTEVSGNATKFRKAGIDVPPTWNNFIPFGFGKKWWLDPKSAEQGPSAKSFVYNVAEAKKLLQAVGVPNTPITYQYTDRYGQPFNTLAEAIGNWLRELGLNIQNEVHDYSSKYIPQTFKGNYHGIAFMSSTVFSEPGSYVDRFFGDDPLNHGHVKDEKIRDLHAKQRVEMKEEQRAAYIKEIQKLNAEQMFYAPVQAGTGVSWVAYRKEVRGIRTTRGYGGYAENVPFYWLQS